jgi:hypothetical protein
LVAANQGSHTKGFQKKNFDPLVLLTTWNLWKERNQGRLTARQERHLNCSRLS